MMSKDCLHWLNDHIPRAIGGTTKEDTLVFKQTIEELETWVNLTKLQLDSTRADVVKYRKKYEGAKQAANISTALLVVNGILQLLVWGFL